MIRFLIIVILLFNVHTDKQWILTKTLNVKGGNITIDNLQNIYIISDNTLLKYDKHGNYLSEYSNNYSGLITSVDVSDPMRILIFYEEFNQIIFLDNNLSEIGSPILLDDLNYGPIKLASGSEQSGFWIYCVQLQQILHLNKDLKLVNKSPKLSSIITNDLAPNFLLEKNNNVYLNLPNTGILVFNSYGHYLKTLPLKELDDFQINNQKVTFNRNNCIITFNMKLIDYDTLCINESDSIIDIKVEQDISIVKNKEEILIYKLK